MVRKCLCALVVADSLVIYLAQRFDSDDQFNPIKSKKGKQRTRNTSCIEVGSQTIQLLSLQSSHPHVGGVLSIEYIYRVYIYINSRDYLLESNK